MLPRILWPLLIYEVPMMAEWRWLSLPCSLNNIKLCGNTNKLIWSISAQSGRWSSSWQGEDPEQLLQGARWGLVSMEARRGPQINCWINQGIKGSRYTQGGGSRKREKYQELLKDHLRGGWRTRFMPVEVGSQGFASHWLSNVYVLRISSLLSGGSLVWTIHSHLLTT